MITIHSYNPEKFTDCIERIWIAENDDEETNIVIPPSQFVDFLIPLSEKGFIHNGNHMTNTRLEGIMLKPVYLKLPVHSKMMGIRLYGGGFYPFSPVKGKDILNKNVPFSSEKHQKLLDRISESRDDKSILQTTYSLLSQKYDPKRDEETKLLKEFYFNLRKNQDFMNIETFCRQTGTNYTSLNRIYNKILGISTKKFERLIKFRKALERLLNNPEKLSRIGVNSGYFDQSHFIKEFKYFMDMSPSEYLGLLKQNKEYHIIKTIDFAVI